MLIDKTLNILDWDPYMSTEKTICGLLECDRDKISDDFTLMYMPLASLINKLGFRALNEILNGLRVKNTRRVFICQHLINSILEFRDDDIVFATHSYTHDNYHPMPHYAVNHDKPIEKKVDDFSFIGSIQTHWSRSVITATYDNCHDSGACWGLTRHGDTDEFIGKYIEHTNSFKYALCPRGMGVSTIRFFEAMAMNCTPVLIADDYQLPLEHIIDWDRYVIKVPEKDVLYIHRYLEPKEDIIDIYNKYFANDRLHKTVMLTLNGTTI